MQIGRCRKNTCISMYLDEETKGCLAHTPKISLNQATNYLFSNLGKTPQPNQNKTVLKESV